MKEILNAILNILLDYFLVISQCLFISFIPALVVFILQVIARSEKRKPITRLKAQIAAYNLSWFFLGWILKTSQKIYRSFEADRRAFPFTVYFSMDFTKKGYIKKPSDPEHWASFYEKKKEVPIDETK